MLSSANFKQLVISIIQEAKIDDLKSKYPSIASILDFFDDDMVPPKYLEWIAKQYMTNPAIDKIEMVDDITAFHELTKRNKIPNKDIFAYKTFEDLKDALAVAHGKKSNAERTKDAKNAVQKIFEDEKFLIVKPLTADATRLYGCNTRWCVSSWHSNHWFDQYIKVQQNDLYILIDKEANDSDNLSKVAILVSPHGAVRITDSKDKLTNLDALVKRFPSNVIDSLQQILSRKI